MMSLLHIKFKFVGVTNRRLFQGNGSIHVFLKLGLSENKSNTKTRFDMCHFRADIGHNLHVLLLSIIFEVLKKSCSIIKTNNFFIQSKMKKSNYTIKSRMLVYFEINLI